MKIYKQIFKFLWQRERETKKEQLNQFYWIRWNDPINGQREKIGVVELLRERANNDTEYNEVISCAVVLLQKLMVGTRFPHIV